MKSSIRLTTYADLPIVMEIYATAREFMNRTGNASQWVNGYPAQQFIEEEINLGHSFVIESSVVESSAGEIGSEFASEIIGTFCYIVGEDPTYNKIYEGEWLNDKEYGTVHRIASSGKVKGVALECFNWCFAQLPNVRVDTHRDNKPMQNILAKLEYKYCGIIYLQDGAERLAYQKTE